MKKQKKYFKIAIFSAFAFAVLLQAMMVSASVGNWTSAKSKDMNGVSTVWTTMASRTDGGNASTFTLKVRFGAGGTAGSKTVGATINQKVEHTCWGEPFRDRYGEVLTDNQASHTPGFNS